MPVKIEEVKVKEKRKGRGQQKYDAVLTGAVPRQGLRENLQVYWDSSSGGIRRGFHRSASAAAHLGDHYLVDVC